MKTLLSIIANEKESISPRQSLVINHTTTAQPRYVDVCENEVDTSIESISYVIFMIALLLASVVGNVLVITASILSHQLRKRVTVYFIVSLAISDMVNASVLIPMIVSQRLHYNRFCHGLSTCYWYLLGDTTTTLASILNLVFIAMDRYIAISFPYKHRALFSVANVRKIIIGIWTFSIIWAFCSIIPWTKNKNIPPDDTFSISTANHFCVNNNRPFFAASFLGIYFIPLLLLTFTYAMILKIALTQIHAIESTHIDTPRNGQSTLTDQEAKEQRLKRIKQRELRATKSVGLVYLFFVICWMPAFIVVTILEFDEEVFPELLKENRNLFLFVWYGLLQILPSINTMINPIIYSFSNKGFRKAFKAVYRRFIPKKNLSPSQDRRQRSISGISVGSLPSTTIEPNSQPMTRKYKTLNIFNRKVNTNKSDDKLKTSDKGHVNKSYIVESSLSDDSSQNPSGSN